MKRTCKIGIDEMLDEYKSPSTKDDVDNLLLPKIGNFATESYRPREKTSKAFQESPSILKAYYI